MKKIKPITALLIMAMSLQLFAVAASAKLVVGVSGVPTVADTSEQTLSVPTENAEGNLLTRSNFDSSDCLELWTPMSDQMRIEWLEDENGGYVRTDKITYNYYGFKLYPENEIEKGIYKFTGYFRTYNKGDSTRLRLEFYDAKGAPIKTLTVNCGNEWQKVEYYLIIMNTLGYINVCGAPYFQFIQDYCMDEFSLVKVDSIPKDANKSDTFGDEVNKEKIAEIVYNQTGYSPTYNPEEYLKKYEVKGIMLNNDANSTLVGIGRDPSLVTEASLVKAIRQYENTHVTDFMLTVCNEIATYPSKVWTSGLDKYYQTEENGQAVDYSDSEPCIGTHHVWETLGIDYISLWAENLWDMGINPWLSFRMNDIHDRYLKTSAILSDFYHENPHLRRVTHRAGYPNMGNAYNYTHKEVRDHYLALVNEALSLYDVYGIEFDFQREAFLWHLGGEYAGLDIFNEFMREVDDVIKVYEEKYGHEIKFAVRVPPDPMTNYDLGLDIVTWASEGIVDHVTATGRFECTEFDIPIRLWKSMLSPYGVTVGAGIDTAYVRHTMTSPNAGWTMELYAGFCANAYSQGADKIYILNMNTSATLEFSSRSKITVGRESSGISDARWAFLTTCGSYDKVIEMNRRCTPTFNDTTPVWRKQNNMLPQSVNKSNPATVRIPVGDITVGSKVLLEFSMPDGWLDRIDSFKVYVNSQPCEFKGVFAARPGGVAEFTKNKVTRWEIPTEAQEDVYMIVEVMYEGEGSYSIDHMEVYIETNPGI